MTAIYNAAFYLLVAHFAFRYYLMLLRVLDILQVNRTVLFKVALSITLAIVMTFVILYEFAMIFSLVRVLSEEQSD